MPEGRRVGAVTVRSRATTSVPRNSGTLYFDEVSIFFDLFNPSNRHRTEELRRLENTREDESPGEPGRGPIDLNSGTVLIRVPTKEPAEPAASAAATAREDEDGARDGSADGESAADGGENEDAAASAEGDGGA